MNPGRMFPNEMYFQVFPENEVPEEVRDEFLRGCEIKRQMSAVRSDPDRIIEGVINGLSELRDSGRNVGDGSESGGFPQGNAHAPRTCGLAHRAHQRLPGSFGSHNMGSLSYVLLRRLFDDIYYSVEELAGKYPNEVMDPFKVKRINEILDEIRECLEDKNILPYLRLIDEPNEITDKEGKRLWDGLSYSDILLMLKWYKVLPR